MRPLPLLNPCPTDVFKDAPSPTETTDYLACPQYHAYRWGETRWAQRQLGQRDRIAVFSKAYHTGLAVLYDMTRVIGGEQEHARNFLRRELQQLALDGFEWTVPMPDEALVMNLITQYKKQEIFFSSHVKGVDLRLGHGILDLLIDEPAVVDHKVITLRDARWLPDRLKSFHTSWQARDYCWRASLHLGQPVRKFYANCAVLVEEAVKGKPTGIYEEPLFVVEPVEFSDAELARWNLDAALKWYEMDHDPFEDRPRNLTRCANFGYSKPCDFYTACWGAGMNDVEYVRQMKGGES